MNKEQIIWLYEYLIKQTKEKSVFGDHINLFGTLEIEMEVDKLLIKYDCEPLN